MNPTADAPDRGLDAARPGPGPRLEKRRIASTALLGQARALIIVHAGAEYQLRVTKNGKLILTK